MTNAENKYQATFEWHDASANAVHLQGSFTGWMDDSNIPLKKENGVWRVVVPLTYSAKHQYRFKVDGEWKIDTRQESAHGSPLNVPINYFFAPNQPPSANRADKKKNKKKNKKKSKAANGDAHESEDEHEDDDVVEHLTEEKGVKAEDKDTGKEKVTAASTAWPAIPSATHTPKDEKPSVQKNAEADKSEADKHKSKASETKEQADKAVDQPAQSAQAAQTAETAQSAQPQEAQTSSGGGPSPDTGAEKESQPANESKDGGIKENGADSNENKNQNREASAFEGILAGATAGALNQNRQQEMSAEQNKPTEEVAAAPVDKTTEQAKESTTKESQTEDNEDVLEKTNVKSDKEGVAAEVPTNAETSGKDIDQKIEAAEKKDEAPKEEASKIKEDVESKPAEAKEGAAEAKDDAKDEAKDAAKPEEKKDDEPKKASLSKRISKRISGIFHLPSKKN